MRIRRLSWLLPVLCMLWLGWSSLAIAESHPSLDYIQRNRLQIQIGWTGIVLNKGGETARPGLMGLGIERLFQESPEALNLMGTYRSLRLSGFVLWTLGLATLVTEIVLLLAAPSLMRGNIAGLSPLFWGLMIGGSVVGFAGGIMMSASNLFLSRAVSVYNRDLFRRARKRKWSLHFQILPQGAMLAMGYRF